MFLESSERSERGRQSEPGGRRWTPLSSVLPLGGEAEKVGEKDREEERKIKPTKNK